MDIMKYLVEFEKFIAGLFDIKIHEEKLRSYGCLMLDFAFEDWDEWIKKYVDEKDLYTEDNKGYSDNPHVTILYGFHDEEVDHNELEKDIKEKITAPIINFKNISVFENEKFDVVKFDLKHDSLNEMNEYFKKFPHTDTFPEYKPHVTIAYVKSGLGKKYIKTLDKAIEVQPHKVVYSKPNDEKKEYNIDK